MGAIQRTEHETLQNETRTGITKMTNSKYFTIRNNDILVDNIEVFSFVIAAVTDNRVYNKPLVAKVLKAVGAPEHADLAQFGAQEKAIIETLKATFTRHGMLSKAQAQNVNAAFAAICYAITNTILDFFYTNETVTDADMAAVVAIFNKYFTAQVQAANIEGIEAAATEYNFHDFDSVVDGRTTKIYFADGQSIEVKIDYGTMEEVPASSKAPRNEPRPDTYMNRFNGPNTPVNFACIIDWEDEEEL